MSVPSPAAVVKMTEHMKKIVESAKDAGKALSNLKKRTYHDDPTARMTYRPFADSHALRALQEKLSTAPEGTERVQ